MKKIVVLMGAAIVACVSQAASVNWSASGLANEYKGQSFYLFDASKKADVLALLSTVDSATTSSLEGMALYTGTASTKGKASATSLDVGSTTSLMSLVLAGAPADGVSYQYMVEDIGSYVFEPPNTPPLGTFTSTLATAGTAGTMSGGSTPIDTPEPTSGLLLLVGLAGLALKRKVA